MFVILRLACYVEAMKNLFEKYGEVLECQIIQDPVTKRSRLVVMVCKKGACCAVQASKRELAFYIHVLIHAPILQGIWIRHLPRPGERAGRPRGTRTRAAYAGPQKGGLIV